MSTSTITSRKSCGTADSADTMSSCDSRSTTRSSSGTEPSDSASLSSDMGGLLGEEYGDNRSGDGPEQEGTRPGEGRLDEPATTGTHRGWGDPQAGEDLREDDND